MMLRLIHTFAMFCVAFVLAALATVYSHQGHNLLALVTAGEACLFLGAVVTRAKG